MRELTDSDESSRYLSESSTDQTYPSMLNSTDVDGSRCSSTLKREVEPVDSSSCFDTIHTRDVACTSNEPVISKSEGKNGSRRSRGRRASTYPGP